MKDEQLILIPIVLCLVLFESVAQFHIKKGREQESTIFIGVGLVSYCVVGLILFHCYKFEGIGGINLIWSVLSLISMTTIGYLFFDEDINIYDLCGIGFCVFGLYFIFTFGHRSLRK